MKVLTVLVAAALIALLVFALRPAVNSDTQAIEHGPEARPSPPILDEEVAALRPEAEPRRSTAERPGGVVEAIELDTAASATKPANLTILLEDSRGAPLPHHPLLVDWRKGFGKFGVDELVTDAEGRAGTTVLSTYQIEGFRCTHPDREAELDVLTSPLVVSPEDPRLLRLRIAPIVTQLFAVTDERGAPIEGATLKIEPPWLAAEDPTLHYLVARPSNEPRSTDAHGMIAWDLSTGYWDAEVRAPGYSGLDDVLISVEGPVPGDVITFQLGSRRVVPNREVALEVVLPKGGSGPEFRVVQDVENADPLPTDWQTNPGATRVGGDFRLRVPKEGRWALRGRARGCADLRMPIPPRAERIVAEFDPRPQDQVLEGIVVSATDGSPLEAQVSLHQNIQYSSSDSTYSKLDGRFRFDYRFQGSGFVRAEAEGYAFCFVGPLSVPLQESVVIRLHSATNLAGRAVDTDGEPVEGSVTLYRSTLQWDKPGDIAAPRIMSRSFDRRTTGKDGKFSFDDVPEGPLRITFSPEGGKLPKKTVDTFGGAPDLKITLPPRDDQLASLRGRATRADTGEPLADVQISFGRWPDGSSWTHTTDKDGRYDIHSLTPGERTIHAAMAMERPVKFVPFTAESLRLVPGENRLDVSLEPSTVLHLKVVDEYGAPIRRAWLRGEKMDGSQLFLQEDYGGIDPDLSTDAIGRLDLYGVPKAPVRLLIGRKRDDHKNGKAQEFDVDPLSLPGQVITLRLLGEF